MGKQFDQLSDDHIKTIEAQHMFFSATAAPDGLVNVSPKGMDSLRVLSPNRIIWLNMTGSGNETAAHLAEHPRMTLMWCSFTTRPVILRTYGTATCIHRNAPEWETLITHFGDRPEARQIYDLTINMVQTSCGYAVPFFDHVGERDTLKKWAADKGANGIRTYWETRNSRSLDGKPTGIEANLPS